MRLSLLLPLLVLLLLPPSAWADSVVFQHDGSNAYNNTYDASFWPRTDGTPAYRNRNYGGDALLTIGERNAANGWPWRTVLWYPNIADHPSIPSAADADSAILSLYLYQFDATRCNTADCNTLYLYGLDSNFAEGSGTGGVGDTTDVTNMHRDKEAGATDSAWTPGGDFTTLYDSVVVDTGSFPYWVSWTIPKSKCSTDIATPTLNKGYIIRWKSDTQSAQTKDNYVQARSRNYSTAADRPKYTIYSTPAAGGAPAGRRARLLGYEKPTSENFDLPRVPTFQTVLAGELITPGDLNADDRVTLGDAIHLINYTLRDGTPPVRDSSLEVFTWDCEITADDRRIDGDYGAVFIDVPEEEVTP